MVPGVPPGRTTADKEKPQVTRSHVDVEYLLQKFYGLCEIPRKFLVSIGGKRARPSVKVMYTHEPQSWSINTVILYLIYSA